MDVIQRIYLALFVPAVGKDTATIRTTKLKQVTLRTNMLIVPMTVMMAVDLMEES